MPVHERTPSPLPRSGLIIGVLAWCVLVAAIGQLGLNVALRWWASRDGFLPGYSLALLLSWKTILLVFLLVLAFAFFFRALRRARLPGLRRGQVAGVLCGLALLTLLSGAGFHLAYGVWGEEWGGRNRWGFWRVYPPSTTTRDNPRNGEVDLVVATTNSHSYRDDEWAIPPPDDGTKRVLLVGDSVVFGLSITHKKDLLDTLLETRLNAGGAGRWDVWNIANPPSSLWYFTEAILRVAPDARPRYAIQYLYCDHDVTFYDEQAALADKPPAFYRLARWTGVDKDLLWMARNPWPYNYEVADNPTVLPARLAHFERLLAFCRETDLHLVVWEGNGPCGFFDPYRGRPEVSFLSWREEVGRSCGDDPRFCRFYRDPELGHPSGHLTPRGNALVADAIAPRLLELERARAAPPSP